MRAILERRGDGVYMRIPASGLRSAKLRWGEPVNVREQSGAIVIEPTDRKEYNIEKLIEKSTPESLHGEIVVSGIERKAEADPSTAQRPSPGRKLPTLRPHRARLASG